MIDYVASYFRSPTGIAVKNPGFFTRRNVKYTCEQINTAHSERNSALIGHVTNTLMS